MYSSIPKVIACLPTYNAEKFIAKTLQCLLKQSYPNFQVLISDDCSADHTVEVIQSIINESQKFTLIQQEKKLGWVDNINFLMEKAVNMGGYVFIMPHDDHIDPEYVAKLTGVLEENPDAAIAFSDMKLTYVGGRTENIRYNILQGLKNRIERTKSLLRYEGRWSIAYRGIARAEAIQQIIPLKKNIAGNRDFILDWIWLVKLSLLGEFMTVPETLYFKYFQKTSASVQWTEENWNFINSYFNCSLALLRSKIPVKEQFIYQAIVYEMIIKRMIIGSGLYSLYKKLAFARKR